MSRAEPLGPSFPARRQPSASAVTGRTAERAVDEHAASSTLGVLRKLVPDAVSRPRLLRGPRIEQPVDARPIQTPRLLLRRHELRDAESWYRIQSSPDVLAHLPWPARDRAASREHLRHRTGHTRLWQSGDFLALAIEHGGRLIGDVSLHLRQVRTADRSAEIGWVLDPAAGGHGYATEAAGAMLDLAFEQVRATVVTAVIEPENTASIALAERLGFLRTAGPRRSSSLGFAITPPLLAARRAERAGLGH
ncbi:GNAT family N-acetyltransferase [Plantibacter flavus]|uniref:GNAT family N-acetyltransferase n=1 Tax=Plantibacter flavus TaxID=150123 RepID=UPI003F1717B4